MLDAGSMSIMGFHGMEPFEILVPDRCFACDCSPGTGLLDLDVVDLDVLTELPR